MALSRLEKTLIFVTTVLSVFAIVFVVLFAVEVSEKAKTTTAPIEVCTSQGCITAASELLNSIDRTIKPCDDFYLYACGGWMKRNPIPSGQKSWDVSSKLKAEIDAFMKENIVNLETRARYSKISAVTKGLKFYDACLNTNLTESSAFAQKLISDYGSCAALSSTWTPSGWNLTITLTKLIKELGISGLFKFGVELDQRNTSTYTITISEPSFRLSRADLKAADPTVRNAYRTYITAILSAVNSSVSAADIDEIIAFEQQIANIMDSSGYAPLYDRITLNEFVTRVGTEQVNWSNLLRGVFSDVGYVVGDSTTVVVHGMPFLKSLMSLIQSTPKRTLANFLVWQILDLFSVDFGRSNIAAYNALMTALGKGSEYSALRRSDFCYNRAMDINAFGMPLSRIFIDKKFSEADKKWIENMAERIKTVFLDKLQSNTWMDDDTKSAAAQKAKVTTASIGYPPYLKDDTELDNKFSDVTVDVSKYFDSSVSLQKSFNKKNLARVGKVKDRDQLAMTPVKVNAYYEDSFTRVVFPAAQLQPPFYDGNYTGAVNYGAIGSTVGHELLHGFDNAGKDFDQHGNRASWWTADTLSKFTEKAQCLVNQYNSYSYYGEQVKGSDSLSENIADNSGMMQAHEAYNAWKKEYGFEPRLPGTSFSSDQIFFLSFAQSWCAIITEEEAKAGFANYSPTPWRVNGTLRNSAAFAKAFDCTVGSPMNPTAKCAVW
ncbi:neprilysin-4 [Nematostella vectensis]|uniref:neprilysin-4 n=1 Tax=Nematostella vectensis TaxID=45351 RepID=UPI00138FAD93|nr:neprilysin-4 [Nematostella vectensis]